MSERQPCPKCRKSVETSRDESKADQQWWIYCPCGVGTDYYETEELLLEWWNQRPEAGELLGYLTKSDLENVRRDGPGVPNVNLWAAQDDGDVPIYLATPSGEMERDHRVQILDALDHAHEYHTPESLAASVRAILASGEEEG